ncbi:molecular chaperone DnaJ [Patescibacteria group bacterium]|nr:molecular chaperone DnaJ [Patescibacteria group bacterium]
MSKDYYKVLGVDKSASPNEIKGAFRRLAHQYHPDKNGSGDEAKFKEINEAYQVLGNTERRKQYDQFGSTFDGSGFSAQGAAPAGGQGPASGWNWSDFANQAGGFRTSGMNFDFEDLGDIFGDIFSNTARRSSSRRTRYRKGSDIEANLTIDFEEAVFGVEKVLDINKTVVCENCKGNGAEPGSKIETCKNCGGSGQVVTTQQTFFGAFRSNTVCSSCEGEGKVASHKCGKCHGKGVLGGKERVKIKIPAGINNNETIKLSGKGEAGEKGTVSGDLYINIRVRSSMEFKREGYDIYSAKTISFSQAALGDKIRVKTLHGEVNLKIPAGTKAGQEFKLRDKGVSKLRGRGRGDQLVKVEVEVPNHLNSRQKKLLEELASEGL